MAANSIVWQQTGDRRVWRAARGGVVLTVTKTAGGMFRADVEGLPARSPEFRTRLAAQQWAEDRSASGKRHGRGNDVPQAVWKHEGRPRCRERPSAAV